VYIEEIVAMQMFKAVGQNILIERSSLDKTRQTHVISRETRVEISACLVRTESRSILLLKKNALFLPPLRVLFARYYFSADNRVLSFFMTQSRQNY